MLKTSSFALNFQHFPGDLVKTNARKNMLDPILTCLEDLASTQLSMKFILFINVKMPTTVGILTFISRINTISDISVLKQEMVLFFSISIFMSSGNFMLS